MKVIKVVLFAGLASAHSTAMGITIDGNYYPARDARLDKDIGAKRIEWHYKDVNGFATMAVTDVLDPSITCGLDSKAPELKAVSRAGANVTVQWTGIIGMHQGPVMSYLGAWSPGMKPQDIKFFKISELGFDSQKKSWANEELIKLGHTETFPLPSDIKPGTYVLRTELLALHGNSMSSAPTSFSGPQFYTHCFNVDIKGNGNVSPPGVTFPGGYKRDDPGVKFNLYNNKAAWDKYVIPGPPKYNGKYDAPTGSPPVVSATERGAFPPEFEAKYQDVKKKADKWMYESVAAVNNGSYATLGGRLIEYITNHYQDFIDYNNGLTALKKEAIKIGLTAPGQA